MRSTSGIEFGIGSIDGGSVIPALTGKTGKGCANKADKSGPDCGEVCACENADNENDKHKSNKKTDFRLDLHIISFSF